MGEDTKLSISKGMDSENGKKKKKSGHFVNQPKTHPYFIFYSPLGL